MITPLAAPLPDPDELQADLDRLNHIWLARGVYPRAEVFAIADKHGRSPETVRGWLNGRSTGRHTESLMSDEALTRICQMKDVKHAWSELAEEGVVTCCYPTFWRAWKRLAPAIRTGLLKGAKALRAKQLYARYPVGARMNLILLDATMADNYVYPTQGKKPIRPWLAFALERKTQWLWIAVIEGHPDGEVHCALLGDIAVGQTLPDGTFIGGVAHACKIDRGRDYIGETHTAALTRVGTVVLACEPRTPYQKGPVEEVIGPFHERLSTTTPGYVGNFVLGQRDAWHPDDGRLLTFEEYAEKVRQDLWWWNTEWRSETLGNKTHLEAWQAETTAITRLESEREEDLAALFLRRAETRVATKNGMSFRGRLYLDKAMLPYVGQRLQIGYSDHDPSGRQDPSVLYVFRDDKYVCTARPASEFNPEEGKALKRERGKQVRLVSRIQKQAAKRRSAAAPADRESASRFVTRERTPRSDPRAHQGGKAILHTLARRRQDQTKEPQS